MIHVHGPTRRPASPSSLASTYSTEKNPSWFGPFEQVTSNWNWQYNSLASPISTSTTASTAGGPGSSAYPHITANSLSGTQQSYISSSESPHNGGYSPPDTCTCPHINRTGQSTLSLERVLPGLNLSQTQTQNMIQNQNQTASSSRSSISNMTPSHGYPIARPISPPLAVPPLVVDSTVPGSSPWNISPSRSPDLPDLRSPQASSGTFERRGSYAWEVGHRQTEDPTNEWNTTNISMSEEYPSFSRRHYSTRQLQAPMPIAKPQVVGTELHHAQPKFDIFRQQQIHGADLMRVPTPPQEFRHQPRRGSAQAAMTGSVQVQECEACRTARCPKRQPATSDFALWVGNLPQRTSLLELCRLFGTEEMISIYLINRTGCAFVNFKTEDSLEDAMALFNQRGAKLRDHKLVIKAQKKNSGARAPENSVARALGARNRYFICKSLTVQDLEQARTSLQWSTQEHNRDKFNLAFKTSANVFFIFSANRNSSFYGLARMESLIPDAPTSAVSKPEEAVASYSESNPAIRIENVPACNRDGIVYPAGQIVEDLGSGCLFWEALGYENSNQPDDASHWTAPCAIKWITAPGMSVPFTKTRHMRNPFNSNKPVKIARDGTEIEPGLGDQLIGMFERS